MAAVINWMLICAVLPVTLGCSIAGVSCVRAKASQDTALSAPLPAGSTLLAQTHNGAIAVNGIDSSGCMVKATVRAQALTEARARELVAATKVDLAPSAGGLTVVIDKPHTGVSESISIDLDISAPKSARLDLSSHNGRITVTGMCAGAKVRSHNGNVTLERISGDVDTEAYNGHTECTDIDGNVAAESHNGPVRLEKITGNVSAESYNGRLAVVYAENASSAPEVTITSHNGSVSLTTPKGFSATAEISTRNGRVDCNAPFMLERKSRGEMTGRFGDGKGKLKIRSYNGNVEIN